MYHLDPEKAFSFWISMISNFKKKKVKLELLTGADMLLLVEKGVRGGICDAIDQYGKSNNKNKESSSLKYQDVDNLYGWAMF